MTIRILIGLLFFCSTLQGFQLAGAGTGTRPENAANRFESHGQSALHTVVNFGRETKTPLGVVLGDRALCDQQVDVMSEGDSAEVVIASILSTIPTYKWSVQDNVVVVEPREPRRSKTGAQHDPDAVAIDPCWYFVERTTAADPGIHLSRPPVVGRDRVEPAPVPTVHSCQIGAAERVHFMIAVEGKGAARSRRPKTTRFPDF